ncbi:MAG: hypothetical protein ABI255_07595 [Microbacteriaceae bacterium]
MSRRNGPRRVIGVTIGALVILALGVYGPATLLGPLPPVEVEQLSPPAPDSSVSPPVMPETGASAVTTAADAPPLAVAGESQPLPIAGITKVIAALVILEEKPLEAGRNGPAITIGIEDYRSYIDNSNAGNATVTVLPGETWTQREMLQAMLLGSSNNHAESLARWAFGSGASFLDAADRWLAAHGLGSTRLADSTGLSDDNLSTATDLATVAAVAATDPTIAELLSSAADLGSHGRGFSNRTQYLPERGVTGISRSYTDNAGICLLYSATVPVGEETFSFFGVFIGQPDWETLDEAAAALMDSAETGIQHQWLVAAGDAYASISTLWGDTADAVAILDRTELGWLQEKPTSTITITEFSASPRGTVVGSVEVTGSSGTVSAPLELDAAIDGPSLFWRLLHPVPLVREWFAHPPFQPTPNPTPSGMPVPSEAPESSP